MIISTLFGCPVKCRICDAGGNYQGKLGKNDMLELIDFIVTNRFPDRRVPAEKFKIQFARIGEPSFNENVLETLKELPSRYHAPGLMPCISTIAPENTDDFFTELLDIKKQYYGGHFQLQFSIHTTDPVLRDWLMPISKWDFEKIADYGEKFCTEKDRKITLNFAIAEGMPVDANILKAAFDPRKFLIKLTPVNPTYAAMKNEIISHIQPGRSRYEVIDSLRHVGYDVLLSIGELEENQIGSNCGQYITHYQKNRQKIAGAYTYQIDNHY